MPRLPLGKTLLVIGALVLVPALVSAWSYFWYDESNTATKMAVAATSPAITANDVQIDGWIDDRRVTPGEPIKFWVVVQNPVLAKDIQNVEIVALRRPNFVIPNGQQRCWKTIPGAAGMPPEIVPVCRDTADPATPRLPHPKVPPGGSVTVEGHLLAGPGHGRFGLTAVVGWVDASGAHRRKPISVAPIIVENYWRNRAVYFARIMQSVLRDFALPVVLLWLGFRIKTIETTREETRKKTDDRIARVQQTWTLMLPKVHANAEKYYIPLMSYAASARKYYPTDVEYCFFFYSSFLACMKRLNDDVSGFYLKDIMGEEVVSRIWEMLMDEADGEQWFGRMKRERLQMGVKPNLTYVEFTEILKNNAAVNKARRIFLNRTREFSRQLPLFELFERSLGFEANICYIVWYDEPPAFPTDAFNAAIKRFEDTLGPDESAKRSLVDLLRSYAKAASKRASSLPEEISET